ncbi:unnamed protein product (macronuclear) [Paramecium tetraurelia]|uniref:Uncharacterized protein n=1 Tax=Paramecium tetraurelia TaxID=5888 RepID=A0BS01_PARTE|nr:uncharacterized protein GSPATT00031549001 [Paramecium tetraurelia]CAK61318.1 unnamed protein product [Paramecium tetraurelia]|eukprot:XP_001428716.1 hypothetical protein (macronuclear) [Paramecium tetraurelia strain d4-2]
MKKSVLMHILNSNNENLKDISRQLLNIGIRKVFYELSRPFEQVLFPEYMIKLLSVFHYMIQEKTLQKDEFVDNHIFSITNSQEGNAIMERLQTDLNLTASRSVNLAPSWDGTPKSYIHNNYFKASPEQKKSATDKKIEFKQLRDPLNYQQILQLYYTYLKKVCMQQNSGVPIIDCFVIQNIQCMGLRIIEGQRNQKLAFCFNLIIRDMISYQSQIIELVSNSMNNVEKTQIHEVYIQMYLNSKQLKYYGKQNRVKIDQSQFKEFKNNQNIHRLKLKLCESRERMEQKDLKDEQNFFNYERTQLYNQF